MAAINIAFDIPQSPNFSVEDFRRQMTSYAKRLIVTLSATKQDKASEVFFSPEVTSLIGIVPDFTEEELMEDERLRQILEH